jgi:hypothetical protein
MKILGMAAVMLLAVLGTTVMADARGVPLFIPHSPDWLHLGECGICSANDLPSRF